MVVRVDVSPDLLAWAVERAGWDAPEVEKKAPQFNKWVTGDTKPTLKQLQHFADRAHVPFGQLFLSEPPVEDLPIKDMRTLRNVDVSRPSPDLLDTIYLCQDRQDWYRWYARENGIPGPRFLGSATLDTPTETVATRLRADLEFEPSMRGYFPTWDDAYRALIDRIEDIGVLVMVSGIVGGNTKRKLDPQEFRGFALYDPVAPLVFVNGSDTKAARIFTLIHELGHLCLGESALSDVAVADEVRVQSELWCNRMAAEFLVPRDGLKSEYEGTADSDELQRLAKTFRVSTLVVLTSLYDAKVLSWDEYRTLYEEEHSRVVKMAEERRAKNRSGGNYYHTQPLRISRQFARAVISSAQEGSTPFREAYELFLGLRRPRPLILSPRSLELNSVSARRTCRRYRSRFLGVA